MTITADISMYPLTPNYESIILSFIHKLHTYKDLHVQTNAMSTQVFGEYGQVIQALSKEMESFFGKPETVVVVVKFVNLDRRQ